MIRITWIAGLLLLNFVRLCVRDTKAYEDAELRRSKPESRTTRPLNEKDAKGEGR